MAAPRKHKGHKKNGCDTDTVAKCHPALLELAHYHLCHSLNAATFDELCPDPNLFGQLPDVYVVSDPDTRQRFRELAARIRAENSEATKELDRWLALPSGPELEPTPQGETAGLDVPDRPAQK